jgi:hypothetical protein
MARYAKVDVRIWDDAKVARLTPIPPCGQGLWIRLLISRHRTSIPGLLCVGEAALAEEFGWTLEAFREAFREAHKEGLVKADWKSRLVWIPNAIKFNQPESPNVVKSWAVHWDETPECSLKWEAYRSLGGFIKGLTEGFRKAFGEACGKGIANQEQEQDQEQEQEKESPSAGACDPCATGTEHGIRPKHMQAAGWFEKFKLAWCKSKEKLSYAHPSDSVARGRFDSMLDGLDPGDVLEAWNRKEAVFAEFLETNDRKAQECGHIFAFFASNFLAYMIPKVKRKDTKPFQEPQKVWRVLDR